MITDEIVYQTGRAFAFAPTREQQAAMEVFARFLTDRRPHCCMVLRGSAGTGKTSLAAAMVRAMAALGQKTVLLAPTGRAAKVFSLNCRQGGPEGAGSPATAFTIHRKIYRQRSVEGPFQLGDDLHTDTLFVVDEASMVSDNPGGSSALAGLAAGNSAGGPLFGNSLLDDLVGYVYAGRNCRLMLIGDQAQLPPVGETESPALQRDVLERHGLTVCEATLNEVLRQSEQSGILWNATRIRTLLTAGDRHTALPRIRFRGFADIVAVTGNELIDTLAGSYREVGLDETMVITRSNKRAIVYNQGIRARVLDREEELCTGDLLMLVKNKYGVGPDSSQEQTGANGSTGASQGRAGRQPAVAGNRFLANGDRCQVRRVRHERSFYGLRFADVWLSFPDYDGYELQTTVILDSLTAEAPSLTREQQEQLFQGVMEDYADLPRKADRLKALRDDPYYNALQVKYAYAVTCHKAQGGQWAHVYVDQGYMTDEMLTPDYVHWLYTAFTRATERLYLVNWPGTQTEQAP